MEAKKKKRCLVESRWNPQCHTCLLD